MGNSINLLTLHKIGCVQQFESELSLRSLALSLHKIGCVQQLESKLSLRSLALSLQRKDPSNAFIMALNTDKNLKLYFSIKEVAKMFDINESTLRYWESEFPLLKPKTQGASKVRQYTQKDIDQIKVIYNLVKVRGFKLAAARKMLNENREGADRSAAVMETLVAVRDELKELKRHLDGLV